MLYLGRHRLRTPDREPREAVAPDWPARLAELADAAGDPRLQRFYGAGMVAADTPLAEVPLVALDFETTGLDPERDGIVSIGLVPLTLARIRCAGARQWLVRPRVPLTGSSVVIHRITHGSLAAAPDLAEVLEALLAALAGRVVVVHHRGIERRFLDAALRRRLGEGIEFPVIDTLALEARRWRQQPPTLWQRLRGVRPASLRLDDCRARYRLPPYRAHEALTDALATAELFQAQVADRFSPHTPVSALWL